MTDNCNINNLAKNQVSAIFHSHAIRRSVLPKFTELCVETPCWCPSGWENGNGTSVTEFCYKSVNLSLEELKKNIVLLFPKQELFR